MEEEILDQMIRDRETQIKMIQRKVEEQNRKFERVSSDLAATRDTYGTQHVDQTMTLERLHQRHTKVVQQLKDSSNQLDMKRQQQGAQLHLYNEVMKAVASPESRESSYVLRMQAQLCKAMHSMGMMETQLAIVQGHAGDRQKQLRDMITLTVEDRSQVELKLMNELVLTDNVRREVEVKHKGMIETFSKEKDVLVEKIEKEKEAEENSDAEEEDDDEEEKDELKEILQQGREEMDRLTQENKEELDKLEQLKAKVIASKGEPFLDELVASIAEEFKDREEDEEDEED